MSDERLEEIRARDRACELVIDITAEGAARDRHELLAEVDRLRQDSARQWQPIETAPKDGRYVLVWGEIEGAHGHDVVKSLFRPDFVAGKPYWQWGAPGFIGVVSDPTDWMPLPDPPATEDKD